MSRHPRQAKPADNLKSGHKSGQKLQLERLESRLLFSADLPFVLPDVAAVYAANDDAHTVLSNAASSLTAATSDGTEQAAVELVIVDSATPEYERILQDIQSRAQSASGNSYQVHLLDAGRDGISQITEILQSHSNVSALHLVSHGADGQLRLGNGTLDMLGLLTNAETIAGWSDSFTGDADILVYGCELAASVQGEEFVTTLSQLTSTDVAASEDLTGNVELGGDWTLEYRTGQIDSGLALSSQLQEDFGSVLMDLTVTTTDDTLDSGIAANNATHTTTWLLANQGTDGKISLREAIIAANNTATAGAITITLGSGNYVLTLSGPGENFSEAGDLNLHRDINFVGAGVNQTTIDGNLGGRIFEVIAGSVEISNMTLTRGDATALSDGGAVKVEAVAVASFNNVKINSSSGRNGGGIYNLGVVTLIDVNLDNNSATESGGAVYNANDLAVRTSTFSNNNGNGDGGGIFTGGPGTFTIYNSTISGNQSDGAGGGLHINTGIVSNVTLTNNTADQGGGLVVVGPVLLSNALVAGNIAPLNADISGAVNSQGGNLLGDSTGGSGFVTSDLLNVAPTLGALADNGGPTETHALLAGSRGINEGVNANGEPADQRGYSRDSQADIGAFEYFSPVVETTLTVTTTVDTFDANLLPGENQKNTDWLIANAGTDGLISIREAVIAANNTVHPGPVTIVLAGGGSYTLGSSGQLLVERDIMVNTGGSGLATVTVTGVNRAFDVVGGKLNLADIRLAGGIVTVGNGGAVRIAAGATLSATNAQFGNSQATNGGAIYNAGVLTLLNSSVDSNIATNGGGIFNAGDMSLTNVTVSRNISSASGGGVYSSGAGTVNLTNSTLAENTASLTGGGLAAESASLQNVTVGRNTATSVGGIAVINSGSVTLGNALVTSNTAGSGGDLSGAFNSLGNNLISSPGSATGFVASDILNVSAVFTSDLLSNHGGPTETLALRGASRGINEGNNTGAPVTDQRGVARDTLVDIGAYELVNVPPQITSASTFNVNENSSVPINLTAIDANEDNLQYTLTGSADDALFNLGLSSGQLTFVTPPDFEAPADAGGDNTYNLTLQVTDPSGSFTDQAIAINVDDLATNIVVTTLTDIVDGDTSSTEQLNAHNGSDAAVSLREAIIAANSSTGPVVITFDIAAPLVAGVHTIVLGAAGLPEITTQVIIDGTTDSDYVNSPVIVLDGTATGAGISGIRLAAGINGSTVKGLGIVNFNAAGIYASNSGNHTFVANYIGTDGTQVLGNAGDGISLNNSAGNTIGGSAIALRNVISGNGGNGIDISGTGSDGNVIRGNYIGTSADGTLALGNGSQGVLLHNGAHNTQIGGSVQGQGNVISGNQHGVAISGGGTDANLLYGNRIGTNAAGTQQLGNLGDGVRITGGAGGTLIGGSGTYQGNVISGNVGDGIEINNPGSDNTLIQGNLIGTVVDGTAALGNGRHGIVLYNGVSGTLIGGGAATGNTISGNAGFAVVIDGTSNNAQNNTISGNRIGTDSLGTSAVANGGGGVHIRTGATNNTVGGTTAAERNIIAGNGGDGVLISDAGTESNTVLGNFIGTDATGSAALGNSDGIKIRQGAANNTIGGNTAGARNVISGNTRDGIEIMDSGSNANKVYGNYIGLASNGTAALGNTGHGVVVFNGAQQAQIGGGAAGLRNVISGNGEFGVAVNGNDQKLTINTQIAGNYIGTDFTGSSALGNADGGIYVSNGASNSVIGGDRSAGEGNLISGHATGAGILLEHATTSSNQIVGNFIGTNAAGDAKLANLIGVYVKGAPNTAIGSAAPNLENLISGNTQYGVLFNNNSSAGSSLVGNLVGVDAGRTTALGNGLDGVRFQTGTSQVLVGGVNVDEGNLISGNGGYGVRVLASSEIYLLGNSIGTEYTGTTAVGNALGGVLIGNGSADSSVGDSSVNGGNVISGNNGNGVTVDSAASNIDIAGNTIGLALGGLAVLGNMGNGIALQTANHTIGGSTSGHRNFIGGNSGHGIALLGGSDNSTVTGNYIGVLANGTGDGGNGASGVWVESSGSVIGGTTNAQANLIAYNGGSGVSVLAPGTNNSFSGNAIFENTGLAIDLGNDGITPNVAGDLDTGANDLQNFPQISLAQSNGVDTLVVQGQLESTANSNYRLEFFANKAVTPASPSAAERYLGFVNVTTDGSGVATFDTQLSTLVASGEKISATATQDSTVGPGSTSELSAMVVVSINDRPTTTGIANLSVDEDAPATNFDLTPYFADIQDPDSALSWQIVSVSNPALFSASSISGAGVLNLQHAADQHGVTDITVSATDTSGLSVETTIHYTVSSLNDLPVVTSPVAFSIAENSTSITTITSTDVDGGAPNYAVASGADGALFQINQSSGLLSFIGVPDFESPADGDTDNAYQLTIEVDDGGGVVTTHAITVQVQDVNDNTPVIAPLQTYELSESAADGTSLGVPVASDADVTDTLKNGLIVSGNADGIFFLHPVTGVLSVVNNTNLDFETTTQYTLGLTVSDGVNTSAVQTVTINVLNANEHAIEPVVDNDATADRVSENLAAGATVGITAFSQDRDSGDSITYSLSHNAGGNFQIDASTGVITTAAVLDYRDATSLTVTAVATSSDGSFDSRSFTVQIDNINDAPRFSSAPVVTGTEGSGYSYSISTTDIDGDAVVISAPTLPAWLTLTDNGNGTALLSGTPADADVGANSVEIFVTDGALPVSQAFTITVSDVNDAPQFSSPAVFTVSENELVAGTVVTADLDGGSPLYTLSGGDDDGLFSIDPLTGVLSFNAAPDFEFPLDAGADNKYRVTVQVDDQRGALVTQVIDVTVNDLNDNSAGLVTDTDTASDSVPESAAVGDAVGITVLAGDADAGDSVSYALTSDAQGRFAIDAATGEVTVNAALDFETNTALQIEATATSTDGSVSSRQFTVIVTDVDEAPEFASAPVTAVDEQSLYRYEISVTDPEGQAIAVSAPTLPAWLTLTDNADGTAVLSGTPDDAEVGSHTVLLSVSDGTQQSTQGFVITVNPVNDLPVLSSPARFSVDENQATVGTIQATDVDNTALQYSLAGGFDAALFSIDAASGALTFRVGADFENPSDSGADNVYSVTVQVADGDGGLVTSDVSVSVNNINEFSISAITDQDTNAELVPENSSPGTLVGITTTAVDADSGASVSYSLDNDAGGRFVIDALTGAVRTSATLDYEAAAVHSITVRASSTDGSQVTADFIIAVQDANDITPVIPPISTSISEAAHSGAQIATLGADDPDTVGTLAGWSITSGDPDGVFSIDPLSGQISVADASQLDYETRPEYNLEISVSDGVNQSLPGRVLISVLDVNEAPVIVSTEFQSFSGFLGSVGTLTIVDPETGDLSHLEITGGSAFSAFQVEPQTRELVQTEKLTAGVYTLDLLVTDGEGASSEATLQIRIVQSDGESGFDKPPDAVDGASPDKEAEPVTGEALGVETEEASEEGDIAFTDRLENSASEESGEVSDTDVSTGGLSPTYAAQVEGITTPDTRVPVTLEQTDSTITNNTAGGTNRGYEQILDVLFSDDNRFLTDFNLNVESLDFSLSLTPTMISALDNLHSEVENKADVSSEQLELVVQAGAVVTISLSVGFVTWLLQTGALAATALSTSPLWRTLDPIPVLGGNDTQQRRNDPFGGQPDV